MGRFRTERVAVCRHAEARCQQRGIPRLLVDILFDVADRRVPVSNGREAVSLSRAEAKRLRRAGEPAAMLDRLAGVAVVLEPTGLVVTVLHPIDGRYRRDRRNRRNRRHWRGVA